VARGSGFTDADAPSRALIDACVHCGFCLPTCPTYLLWSEEMDSPRGRIYLMKAALDGRAALTGSFVRHFDACLGCMACVTACPSGVQYGPLIERTRAQIERHHPRGFGDRAFRAFLFALLPYPARLRIALAPLALFQWVIARVRGVRLQPDQDLGRGLGPAKAGHYVQSAGFLKRLRALMTLAPPVSWRSLTTRVAETTPAAGPPRMTVGLLTGCVQRLSFPHVNQATINVLASEGCRVMTPAGQGCCGALALHAGRIDQARALARETIAVFQRAGVDRVAVNAAGCGSCMKEYGDLFADDADWAARARAFSARVRDVSEVIVELGESRATRHPVHARVVYHDACHLAHAQGVRAAPRALLAAIPGLEVHTPADSDICCGSAGIYNLVEPDAAADLGARKARHIAALAPDVVATANPGCMLQIAAAGRRLGFRWRIVHPIELVDQSIRGGATSPNSQ
jgi:glycolate oxidase iron-sulfur subunit